MQKRNAMVNSRGQMSTEGEGWLVAALDPYHDYQLDVEGLPDERSAPSVVQVHNQSYTLTAPVSAGAGNWDASFVYSGFNSSIDFQYAGGGMLTTTTTGIHAFNSAALSSGTAFGAFNVWAGAAGSAISTGAPYTIGDTYKAFGSNKPFDRCRLVGVAFEMHNTTADIYKQGSLTVAMLPDVAEDQTNVYYADTAFASIRLNVQADRGPKYASTVPYLQAIPGSQVWPASNGVYAIPRMTKVPRDSNVFNTTAGTGNSTRVPVVFGTDGKTASLEPTNMSVADGFTVPVFNSVVPSGFSPIQVFLTGLSPQTTLSFTMRTIVEYFPAVDSTLLPLATPSPGLDVRALQLYSLLVQTAPYAVPVDQNAAGEYFRKILSLISNGLVLTAPMFGQYAPIASVAGGLGKMIAGAIPVRKDEAGSRAAPIRKRK